MNACLKRTAENALRYQECKLKQEQILAKIICQTKTFSQRPKGNIYKSLLSLALQLLLYLQYLKGNSLFRYLQCL